MSEGRCDSSDGSTSSLDFYFKSIATQAFKIKVEEIEAQRLEKKGAKK